MIGRSYLLIGMIGMIGVTVWQAQHYYSYDALALWYKWHFIMRISPKRIAHVDSWASDTV